EPIGGRIGWFVCPGNVPQITASSRRSVPDGISSFFAKRPETAEERGLQRRPGWTIGQVHVRFECVDKRSIHLFWRTFVRPGHTSGLLDGNPSGILDPCVLKVVVRFPTRKA